MEKSSGNTFGLVEAGSPTAKRLAKTSPTLACLRRQAKLARMGPKASGGFKGQPPAIESAILEVDGLGASSADPSSAFTTTACAEFSLTGIQRRLFVMASQPVGRAASQRG